MTFDGSPFSDPDSAIDRIEEQIREAQQRAEIAQQMQGDISAIRGRAESARGEVKATTDVNGRLLELDLRPAALELRPADLSALIIATSDSARRSAGAQAIAIAEESFGADSSMSVHLRAELASRDSVEPTDIRYER